jgi:hypothetical protein
MRCFPKRQQSAQVREGVPPQSPYRFSGWNPLTDSKAKLREQNVSIIEFGVAVRVSKSMEDIAKITGGAAEASILFVFPVRIFPSWFPLSYWLSDCRYIGEGGNHPCTSGHAGAIPTRGRASARTFKEPAYAWEPVLYAVAATGNDTVQKSAT